MIISKYFVGAGLWRLLNINLITATGERSPFIGQIDVKFVLEIIVTTTMF
jgi:hypothetical protein